MPLRDHFRPPLDDITSWESLHHAWPTSIAFALNRRLPARFRAELGLHRGASFEFDVSTSDTGESGAAFEAAIALPDQDEFAVRVYDSRRARRLVAAVEIVSPANKDRPDSRELFVARWAARLQQRVSVAIVDPVTTRHFNLYDELLELLELSDPSLTPFPSGIYAVSCRWTHPGEPIGPDGWRFQAWNHILQVGRPLPELPLWLTDDFAVSLELEASYEETCRGLRLT